jgi:CRP-like cAMP-binding protein
LSDFLEVKRREISHRLKELRPLVEEYHQLEAAAAALQSVDGGATATATRSRRGRSRRTGSSTGARRPGRRRGSGTRAAEALSLVQGQPGITIPELADKMGIKQNYLYRVLPGLEQDGKVRKDGRGWHPAAA